MKIYLDDYRPAPEGWVLTKTAPETILKLAAGGVTHLSLDHDLGDGSVDKDGNFQHPGCGYDVLLWIEKAVALGNFVLPESITVHSSNWGARPKMEAAIVAIRKLASKEGE